MLHLKYIALLSLLLSSCAFGRSQDGNKEEIAEKGEVPEVITVPFRLLPNKMIAVSAKLDSIEGWFIFDSGAPRTMVNRKFFRASNRKRGSYSRITDVSGVPMLGRDTYPAHELNFQGIVEKGKEYLSIEMSQMEREDGLEALGMIGSETIEGYDVLFNYTDSTLTFIRPDDTDTYLANAYPQHHLQEVPVEIVQHVPCVAAQIGEDTYQLAIDCGAGGNVLSQSYRRQLAPHSRPVGATELLGVSRIPVRVTQIKVHRLNIGDRLFTSLDFLLHNLRSMGIEAEDGIDGLVGYDVLSKQMTLISMTHKRLIFVD